MSSTAAGWLQFALLVAALAACYVPMGNYMARIFTAKEHWRVERGIYKGDRSGDHGRCLSIMAVDMENSRSVPLQDLLDLIRPGPRNRRQTADILNQVVVVGGRQPHAPGD